MATTPDFVQITLRDDGDGIEAVWARAVSAGLYEITGVPFLHMSPTAGDIVAVSDGEVDKIVKSGGRWVAVYNWFPRDGATAGDIIGPLTQVAKANDLVMDCFEPKTGMAGCAYVAAPRSLTPEQLDALLRSADAPADIDRLLPVAGSVARPTRRAATKKMPAKKKPAAKKKKKAAAKKKKKTAPKKKTAKKKTAKKKKRR
ncbi:MAG TPA: hypothetical protein VGO62_02155 [Myxococcota bacterium]